MNSFDHESFAFDRSTGARRIKGLSVSRQWLVLAVIGAVVASVGGFELLGARVIENGAQKSAAKPVPASPQAAAAAPDRFHPNAEQLSSFGVKPVAAFTFKRDFLTDGKIALNGDRTTPVFSPYSGRVTRIHAAPGDVVKAGDPLFSIEASEFVQGENDLVVAQAGLDTAHGQLRQAETSEARKRALYEAQAGSLQDWQQSQAELSTARSAVRSSEAQVRLARDKLRIYGRPDSEIESIRSGRHIRSVATVAAPIGGTITDRQVGLGQYLQTGASTPQFTVGDLSSVWFVANVRELEASRVHRGATVEVRVHALDDRVYHARIAYVAPSVDPVTHRVAVRAEVDNSDGALKPEMFAAFKIATADSTTGPAVPEEAVIYEGETARVWLLAKDGALELRAIRTGRNSDGMIEVREGLAVGDRVATRGTLFIDRAAKGV